MIQVIQFQCKISANALQMDKLKSAVENRKRNTPEMYKKKIDLCGQSFTVKWFTKLKRNGNKFYLNRIDFRRTVALFEFGVWKMGFLIDIFYDWI